MYTALAYPKNIAQLSKTRFGGISVSFYADLQIITVTFHISKARLDLFLKLMDAHRSLQDFKNR